MTTLSAHGTAAHPAAKLPWLTTRRLHLLVITGLMLPILLPLLINGLSAIFAPFTLLNLAVLPLQVLVLLSSYKDMETIQY